MPLKHSAETAYMLLLAVAICVAGFVASLLPDLPQGLMYWGFCTLIAFLFKLALHRTFRINRADYEFRLLHWFPFAIFVTWLVLQLLDSHFWFAHILRLGFLFLWSLPLVALGLFFTILFSLHVIRRQNVRVGALSVMLVVFLIGAVAAEATGVNPFIQAMIFPKNSVLTDKTEHVLSRVMAFVKTARGGSGMLALNTASSSSQNSSVSSLVSSSSSLSSSVRIRSSSSSSLPVLAVNTVAHPKKLTSSGPESFAVLLATLLAFYCCTLQRRARNRA